MTSRRALFLDKDGVINIDHGYVCTAERTDFIEGIFEVCQAATRQGFLNVVITNQAGIARGYYTEQDFLAYMEWVRGEFRRRGAQIDAVYFCPHHPEYGKGEYLLQCECRKPKPGMLLRAAGDLGIDLAGSVLLGDTDSDVAAGEAAGVGTCVKLPPAPPDSGPVLALDEASVRGVLRALQRAG